MSEKPKAEKPKTRAELEKQIADLKDELASFREAHQNCRTERQREADKNAELRKSVDDLKTRLTMAEADNQRMRGYITRVQEDDVVREELIAVGDPTGEQRLVPKRKPEPFHALSPYAVDRASLQAVAENWARPGYHPERAPPKHWVTY